MLGPEAAGSSHDVRDCGVSPKSEVEGLHGGRAERI